MSFLDNLRIRRNRGRVASMDREATSEDLDALREFARTRVGVEFFVEPETMVTDTTAVAWPPTASGPAAGSAPR